LLAGSCWLPSVEMAIEKLPHLATRISRCVAVVFHPVTEHGPAGNELTAITVIRAIPGRTLIRRVLSWPSSPGSWMSHQHQIAWFRLWRFPRCIFRSWMAGRGLETTRRACSSRSTRGQCLRHAGEVANHFWRRQGRHECEHADLHLLTLCVSRRFSQVPALPRGIVELLCHCAGSHAGLRSTVRRRNPFGLWGSGQRA
jgi:hypothetical protein